MKHYVCDRLQAILLGQSLYISNITITIEPLNSYMKDFENFLCQLFISDV